MPEILILGLVLAVIYQLKHFFADYVFQNTYMLQKGNSDWSFFIPLLAHSAIHGVITLIIAAVILQNAFWAIALMAFDTIVHFFMDRLKAAPQYLGRFQLSGDSQQSQRFWLAFGFDQMVHHLTHIAIIAAILVLKYPS